MTIIHEKNIAELVSDDILISDTQSVLDLIASVRYETGCDRIVIHKSAVCEDFFDLSTGVAGELLQKFVNYRYSLAIIGDFSIYNSKSLRDFIFESNRGNHFFFVETLEEAIKKLNPTD